MPIMSDLNPYYVVINNGSKPSVVADLQSGNNLINRVVDIINPMPFSVVNIEATLTQEEADTLKTDPRIRDVHLDPEKFLGVVKRPHGILTGDFNCSLLYLSDTMINYGLLRSTTSTNYWSTSSSYNGTYTWHLDGSGVDVVIMDTGVEPFHPEFSVNSNGTGGTRVVDLDWTTYGVTAVTGGFMGDYDGHGSNCASIAAGNIRGWAKNANIYSLRIVGPASGASTAPDITTGVTLGTVSELEAWTAITSWHNSKKLVSPFCPTVVSCSYGYDLGIGGTSGSIQHIKYRGTTYTVTTTTGVGSTSYGLLGIAQGGDGTFGYRYPAVEAEMETALAAGVIIVAAAGNNGLKIDLPTGSDFGNTVTQSVLGTYPYHQGSTPSAVTGTICVGALDNVDSTYDAKAPFSATGPRVDIFAPGVMIMGAYSSGTYVFSSVSDPRGRVSTSSGYIYYLNKIAGTSQATPQVTGVVAQMLQIRPQLTATTMKSLLQAVSLKNIINENAYSGGDLSAPFDPVTSAESTGTYTNLASLQGGFNGILFQPFSDPNSLSIN